jgi:hypothetical protein
VQRARGASIVLQYVPGHVELDEQEMADKTAKEAARECKQGQAEISLGLIKAVLRAAQRTQLRARVGQDHLWTRACCGKDPKHEMLPRERQRQLSQLRAGRSTLTHDIAHRFSVIKRDMDVPAKGGNCGLSLRYQRPGRPDKYGPSTTGGCIVTAVAAGSPAHEADIRKGWLLQKVEGWQGLKKEKGYTVELQFRWLPKPACPACDAPCDGTEHLICECPAYFSARNSLFGSPTAPITVLQSEPLKVAKFLESTGRDRPPQLAAAKAAHGAAPPTTTSTPTATTGSTTGTNNNRELNPKTSTTVKPGASSSGGVARPGFGCPRAPD